MTDTDQQPAVWVKSDTDMHGNYLLTVEYSPDTAESFDQTGAIAYAMELFTAAAYANYDAAVLAQSAQQFDMPMPVIANMITNLRADRAPLNQAALGLLKLEPSISATSHKPFLRCSLTNDDPLEWQWDPKDVEQHALYVLQAYPVTILDSAYRRHLVGNVGIDPSRAALVVDNLKEWRTGQ